MKGGERQHYNATLAALTIAGIAFALQQTMVVPALTPLRADLHTTTTWVTWVLTAFMLVSSVATPLLGKLGDQYGKERLLLICLSILFVGSVLSACAWNIWSLIGARAIQGVGGAVFPLSFAIIKDEFPAEKVGMAVGIFSSTFAIGGGLGLVMSGVLIDQLSWRWLFIASATGAAGAAALVHRFVPESPIKTASRVDIPGAVLLSTGMVSLLLGLSEGNHWGWQSPRLLGLFGVSIVAFWLWVVVERRVDEPMIDMRMFVRRPVLLTNITAILAGFSMFGAFVLIANFIQSSPKVGGYGFGASSTVTGLYLLPNTIFGLFGGVIANVIGSRFGSKIPMAIGMLNAGLGIGIVALWHTSAWQIVLGMIVFGAGVPMAFAAMAKLIVDAVRPTETGVAGGMNTVMRLIGGVIGGQVGAVMLTTDTIPGTTIPAESAFTYAFAAAALAAVLGGVLSLFATPVRRRAAIPVLETE